MITLPPLFVSLLYFYLLSLYSSRSYTEALLVPTWKQAMYKMEAFASRGTWELISAPTDVGCRWVFTLKYRPNGYVDGYKARLVVKIILRHIASTILRYYRQLPRWILSGLCSPLLLTCHDHYSNWMSRMFSYMGIFRRKFIWSNLQAMLLGGRQKSFISRRPYMDSSKIQKRGLRSSTLPFLVLAFTSVIQITVSLFDAQNLAS